MNDLTIDIGYKSINHYGEQLCGDHVDIIDQGANSKLIVLADGLGSGVKANILSTLTSKIISTMMAEGMPLESCVRTMASTLPTHSEYGVAYSTFTIIHIKDNETAELIQFDDPHIIFIRDLIHRDYEKVEHEIDGKKIYRSIIDLQEGDILLAMSDGCPHANSDIAYNMDWQSDDIAEFIETIAHVGYPAKTLAGILVDECDRLYGGKPLDDATACIVRVIKRQQVNLLFGPPANRDDCDRMMSLFFSKKGKHIICGGTTASIAAEYLGTDVVSTNSKISGELPPPSEIKGVDLVTEGVVTMDKILKNAKAFLDDENAISNWDFEKDPAAIASRMLFEDATDIHLFIGKAVNPAHSEMQGDYKYMMKMSLADELETCLKKMGKKVTTSYF